MNTSSSPCLPSLRFRASRSAGSNLRISWRSTSGSLCSFGSTSGTGPIHSVDTSDTRSATADVNVKRGCLSGGEFFIAEQVAVPPLYSELYRWSDGPTASDHCWHEFVGFREIKSRPKERGLVVPAMKFIRRFASIDNWTEELSPHFMLGS